MSYSRDNNDNRCWCKASRDILIKNISKSNANLVVWLNYSIQVDKYQSIREVRTHRLRRKVYEFDGFILNLDTRLIYLVWECLAKRILSRSRAVLEEPRYASEGKRASRREEFAFTRFRSKVLKSHEMNGERQLAAAGIL